MRNGGCHICYKRQALLRTSSSSGDGRRMSAVEARVRCWQAQAEQAAAALVYPAPRRSRLAAGRRRRQSSSSRKIAAVYGRQKPRYVPTTTYNGCRRRRRRSSRRYSSTWRFHPEHLVVTRRDLRASMAKPAGIYPRSMRCSYVASSRQRKGETRQIHIVVLCSSHPERYEIIWFLVVYGKNYGSRRYRVVVWREILLPIVQSPSTVGARARDGIAGGSRERNGRCVQRTEIIYGMAGAKMAETPGEYRLRR